MELRKNIGVTSLLVVLGDITRQECDAIVNAANSSLLGGGGVDGAIHRAGGARILEECKAIRAARGGCPPGEAVITTGGNLPVRHVIHTVGPVWKGGSQGEEATLRRAYENSLQLAKSHDVKTIAFPSISTGAYGYPIAKAARVAVATVAGFVQSDQCFHEIRFIVFSERDFREYERALREYGNTLSPV